MTLPDVVSTVPSTPAVKERPILFSAPMVRALLDGTKTQTRRVVKPEGAHHLFQFRGTTAAAGADEPTGEWGWCGSSHVVNKHIRCPYGMPGDLLWVRETYFAFGRWETRYSAKKGRDEWHFVDMTLECGKSYLYDADHPRPQPLAGKRDGGVTPKWWKRPAIFMPRAACRIELEETGVRVERLQDISEADARAEGARECDPVSGREVLLAGASQRGSFVLHYRDIWEQINGPNSWAANPFVWVVEFRRIRP